MKTVYPLLALFSAAIVTAGPLPRHAKLTARINIDVPSRLVMRTEHLGEAAPAPDAAKAAADAMESMHVAEAEARDKAHQEAAAKMEAEHVAKAEAEAKAAQEAAAKMEAEHIAKAEADAKAAQESAAAMEVRLNPQHLGVTI
jgi:hypothetical protein